MNEVIKALRERRSVRKFRAEPVPREMLAEIVDAGLFAPSARGTQNTMILAVTDRALRDRLSDMNRRIGGWDAPFDPFYGAPVVLVVLARRDWPNRVYDGSLVMENLMLAAHSLGLGSIWIHRAREEFESDEGRSLLKELGIADEWEGIGHCALGFADGEPPAPAPRKENRVVWK